MSAPPRTQLELMCDALIFASFKTRGGLEGFAVAALEFLTYTGHVIAKAEELVPDYPPAMIGEDR